MKSILPLLLLLFTSSFSLRAETLPLNGSHTVKGASNTHEEKNSSALEAQRYAVIHAIEQMMEAQPSAIRQLYEERKPTILNEIVSLCSHVENKQDINIKKNEITVKFSAKIDSDQLKDLLQRKEAIKKTVQLDSMEVAVFFTARNVDSVKKQHSSVVTINNLEKKKNASEHGNITDEIVNSDASIIQEETNVTGTASLVTADRISYKLDPPAREEFGASLISRFSEKGFDEIIDGALFDSSTQLDEAYGSGDIVPAKTWRDIISNLKANEPGVQYLVVGTLDIGAPRVDEQTNMWVVEATVTGKIYKMSNNLPRLVAALAPQTQKARAADQLQAKKRAISGITPLAADEILAKLKAKNIIKK